jgi:hypothetical protein
LEGAKSRIQEDCKKKLNLQKHLNEGGGHPTKEYHVLAVGKRLLPHIKLLGPKQRINISTRRKPILTCKG